MKTKILFIAFCVICTASFAQTKTKGRRKKQAAKTAQPQPPPPVAANTLNPPQDTVKKPVPAPLKPFDRPLDGYYKKTDITSAKVTPYPHLREADVAYAKRIWREIDVRDKMNTYLVSPKARLIDILMTAIQNGELTAYSAKPDLTIGDPDGDIFAKPLTPDQAKGALVDTVTEVKYDKNGNAMAPQLVANIFNADSLVKFRLKEDWIFDRQRSVFEPRIIGIAPMVRHRVDGAPAGTPAGDYQPAFWIYFPEARPILATKEVADSQNDNTGLSFDDVFMKRIFNSYIVKESNDEDMSIKQEQFKGTDKLVEAERIKKSLMDWELNLWQY